MADDHHHQQQHDAEKEKKRKKALRRMSKMLMKAWDMPDSDPFQMYKGHSTGSSGGSVLCLTTLGQKIDAGDYGYGRHGWEDFARDFGGIYNRHAHRKTKHAALAKKHLDRVCGILAEKDDSLANAARSAPPPAEPKESHKSKKRKSAVISTDGDEKRHSTVTPNSGASGGGSKKKKRSSSVALKNENETLSERAEQQLEALATFIEEHGGDPSTVQDYRCRVTIKKAAEGSHSTRYDTNYYNEHGRRFRSMIDVARSLNLVDDKARSPAAIKSANLARRRQATAKTSAAKKKEIEAEKKKLRRELDRIRKQYSRASKNLDDFLADDKDSQYPVDDALLYEEQLQESQNGETKLILPTNCPAATIPDIKEFRGLPHHCMPDVLQAWDFLCTFSRTLYLQTISLDDFLSCLTYEPPQGVLGSDDLKTPPVYLGEAHMALLRILLADSSSDDWWWSILETETTEGAQVADAAAKEEEEESNVPLIKVDFPALLADGEDPLMTRSWLQALQSIRKIRDPDMASMKKSVREAMSLVSNKWVLAYLRKAMKLGKTSGAPFMKRAIIWLLDQVGAAKPELSNKPPTKSEVLQQRAKVVEEVSQQMEKLSSAALAVLDDDLVSDAEDEDSDDESDDEDNDEDRKTSGPSEEDEDRAASYIPVKPLPSLVDLLLPPGKPIPPTDLLNPSNWPYLAGAAACRIVHRYKRLRNEVDDGLRESHEFPRLTVKQRREREAVSTARVFTEFVTQDGTEKGPTETAMDHLCAGGDYLELTPLQRLALIRVLIEAFYDTQEAYLVVDSNHKQRTSAVKALDLEQRRAKREAKEKAANYDAAARQDLAMEARNNFLEEKRDEIRKLAEDNPDIPAEEVEEIEEFTEQDILEYDEDTKADFEALPTPESFKKAEVVERIAKMREAEAFDTLSLTVLSMDELIEREKRWIERKEEDFQNLGGDDILLDPGLERIAARKIERLRRDIAKAREAVEHLPSIRAAAVETLKEAVADGTIKSLRAAIRTAKTAKLFGPDEDTNGVWALDVVRDVHMELENAKDLKKVADAKKDVVSKLNKCFIRTEALGSDRFGNRFWRFEYGDQSHVWAEISHVLSEFHPGLDNKPGFVKVVCDDASKLSIGPPDIEDDLHHDSELSAKEFWQFSRREYHESGAIASLAKRSWGCHVNESAIRAIMKGLDSRGIRENELKQVLKEALEDKATDAEGAESAEAQGTDSPKTGDGKVNEDAPEEQKVLHVGDEAAFQSARASTSELIKPQDLDGLTTAIGQRVRLRIVVESTKDREVAHYMVATVDAWKTRQDSVPVETGETEFEPKTKVVDTPVWCAVAENGSESWLSATELLEAICRYKSWKRKDADYFEADAAFLAYRNSMGRYMGKSSDAQNAMSPMRFGEWMVRREAELYQRLKLVTLDNNWGGKNGARNAWITSMKEYSFDFKTVQDGLLTLENAIFELIGGTWKDDDASNNDVSGKDLLANPKSREDIELESIDHVVAGLWNTRASRNVFLEIVKRSKTVGFLFLAFELICRNTTVYIQAHHPKGAAPLGLTNSVSDSYEQLAPLPMRTTRRMNAWQQQQAAEAQAYWDSTPQSSRTSRRMNAWQQAGQDWNY